METSHGRNVQGGTTCDMYQDSVVADETRKWIKFNLTRSEHNLDGTGARTASSSPQLTTTSAGRATMLKMRNLPSVETHGMFW